jgi:hypothetical protein
MSQIERDSLRLEPEPIPGPEWGLELTSEAELGSGSPAEEAIFPGWKRSDSSRYGQGWYDVPSGYSVAEALSHFTPEPFNRQPAPDDAQEDEPFSLKNFPDPEWDRLGVRGRVAQLLFDSGLKSKAHRFARCHRTAIPYDCANLSCREKFFTRYHCDCRFCKHCGPLLFSELRDRYSDTISYFLGDQQKKGLLSGRTLARLNFTMKSDGSLPTRKRIRAFNRAIRRTLKVAVPRGESRKLAYGVLWSDEFGYERKGRKKRRAAQGLNLHAHALYYGPRLDWATVRDAWAESLRLEGLEGQGFYATFLKGWQSNPGLTVKRALSHMLKYISKIPAETPERIAALEVAFNGVRRVHAGGLFYRLPKVEERLQILHEQPLVCPCCGSGLVRAGGCQPWESFRVDILQAEGRRDLGEARRAKEQSHRDAMDAAIRLYGGGP